MANCTSKQKIRDTSAEIIIPIYSDSKITFQTDSFKSLFSLLSCPIQNNLIIDRKKEIEHNNPFISFNYAPLNFKETKQAKWKVIRYREVLQSSQNNFKYWFYREKSPIQAHGPGLLYCRGRHSEFLVEGKFNQNDVLLEEKYLKIFGNGMVYFGPLNQQLDPHGIGELIYNKNDRYIGEFRMGIPHGEGEKKGKDSKFVGTFDKGEKIKGTLEDLLGKYQGSFLDNMKEGLGIFINGNGLKYVGNFRKNKKHGSGEVFDSTDAFMFRGVWKNDRLVTKIE